MSKISRFLTFLLVLAVATGSLAGALSYRRAVAAQWQEKVDAWVLQTATEQSQTEFLVYLNEQADLSATETMDTKLEKGTYVYETLSALAERTQKPVLAQLDALNVEYKSFWVSNMIWVRGDMSVVQAMAQRTDVAHLYANPTIAFETLPEEDQQTLLNPEAIEWNILMVNADDVWAAGATGQGVVIGGQDTGYDWDHPALIDQYRGWNGSTADHNYNWFDAIGGNASCPNPGIPCDDYGHGTHTMGTMVGDDGGSNQIGMAPGAKWIGCRNMDNGNGTPATYSACYQFFIAPTDVAGNNPNPAMAPDVINNSWGCPASEGCNANSLLSIVQAVRAAGILTVHSAGNDGSSCSTVNTPSAIYEESFSVGSTTSSNIMSSFSSRGPVTVDGSNRLKPNISAPGSSIRSSVPGTGYSSMSGTSMAGPHVAGLVALVISANPSLAGNIDLIEDIIEQTAVTVTVNPPQVCGGISSNTIPNNTYGWGRIDAFAAYQQAIAVVAETLDLTKVASEDYVAPGDLITYTLSVTHTLGFSMTQNVVLTDVIPANTTFVTATLPHSFAGQTVTWDGPDLNVGESFDVTLVVQVNGDATGSVSNADYAVTGDNTGTTTGTPVETPVIAYGLGLSKTASAAYVLGGDVLTYTLTVTNEHPLALATGLVLTDVIPTRTTFMTATLPHTLNGNTVEWDAASLAAAGVWTVDLVVQVDGEASGTVDNTDYAVSSDQVSPVSGAIVTTPVETLGVQLTPDGTATVLPGEVVTYTHMLVNSGSITETFDLSYLSSEGWTPAFSGPVTLGPGASLEVVVVLSVPTDTISGTVDTLTLTATSQTDASVTASATDTTTVLDTLPALTPRIYLPLVLGGE